MIDKDTAAEARRLGEKLQQEGLRVGTAESCTGGLVAAAITDIAGSSGWFDEGLVTYSNASKMRLLNVDSSTLEHHGAVSQQVVEAMVAGVIARGAQLAVATSGIAGPDGGSQDKPVGTVWIGWRLHDRVFSRCYLFTGDRAAVRKQATLMALREANQILDRGKDFTV